MKDEFLDIYKQWVTRPGADEFLKWLEDTDFFAAPASTRFHLSRPGGLVEHSVHVYERLLRLYRAEHTDPDDHGEYFLTPEEMETVAIIGLLHDICKVNVYRQEPKNQKTYDPEKVAAAQKWQVKHDALGDFIWETVMGYSFDDQLPYGHGEKSVYIISAFMKLSREEAMAIRWHMGFSDTEFKAGGNGVGNAFDKFPLAVLAHIADLQASYLDEPRQE